MNLLFSKEKSDLEVSRQAMDACEHIIAEMGAEIHDDLIQRLSIFRLSIDKLERSLSDKVESELLLTSMKGEFQEVIQSVRKISRKLLPVKTDDATFQESVAWLCQNMERPGTGNVHFEATGKEQDVPPMAGTYLSRIIQELIHNAYKHSAAWHVWVKMQWTEGSLHIEVEDDGSGFSKISEFIDRLRKKHNTLRMRSDALGITLHYSHGQKGLLTSLTFPIPHKVVSA